MTIIHNYGYRIRLIDWPIYLIMNNFLWKYKKHDLSDINKISDIFSVPNSIASIMSLKKINNKERARLFFYNDFNNLHNPL